MAACENCRRDTAHDTIPAQQIGNHPIPAYTVCSYCGWAVPHRGDRMTTDARAAAWITAWDCLTESDRCRKKSMACT